MNLHRDPDAVVAAWLDEGPTRLPPETRQAIAVGIRTLPRRTFAFWGRLGVPSFDLGRLSLALGSGAVVVLATAIALNFYLNQRAISGPAVEPRSPFAGTWVNTTDADGGTQTMTVNVSVAGAVDITVRDDVATVCSGTSSTMTGTGRIESATRLVIPAPEYICDDGSEAKALSGPPLAEQLRNLTYIYHAETDTLTVGDDAGPVWRREGAPNSSAAPANQSAIWPQTTVEAVREAQAQADAGDPRYAWQIDPGLASDDPWLSMRDHDPGIIARYLREKLGWEAFLLNPFEGGNDENGPSDGTFADLVYIRCAPGATNPLYPNGPWGAGACAPTIDELRYESVSLDITQPGKRGATGIWVVSRSATAPPFAQIAPPTAAATELVNKLLSARIAGAGAETFIDGDLPLMYATTSGAPYERFEVDVDGGPEWPYGSMEFKVRLFGDGGGTVVEQLLFLTNDGGSPELRYRPYAPTAPTTENGQPVALPYRFLDGGWVSLRAAYPWYEDTFNDAGLTLNREYWERLELVADPLTVGTGCASGSSAVDAEALATAIQSDHDLVSTAPVAVAVGGLPGLSMDITAAPGASVCTEVPGTQVLTPDDNGSWRGLTLPPDGRMRLYLLDLPEGSPARILAIAVAAAEPRFDAVMEAAVPVLDSVELVAR